MAIFKGAGVAIATPMKENLEINFDKLDEMLEEQIAGGTDAIIICGTTGESATMTEEEHAAVKKVCDIIHSKNLIPCTACRYCIDGCPKHISIPDLFATMNTKQLYHDWNADYYYHEVHARSGHKASDCVKCGRCEEACPQHLPIRNALAQLQQELD